MADLKAAIREMLSRGMTPQQVKDNLRELGVENVDEMFAAATESLKGVSLSAKASKALRESGVTEFSLAAGESAAEPVEKEAPSKIAAELEKVASEATPGTYEEKLDEALALLKALQEINKKILDTNREVLLRLKG